jgi:hypothetical protein
LEIRELFGFGAGTKVREDSKSVGIGKRATIELAELPGAEIRAIMQPLKSGSGVAVSFKSVFREKKGEWDLNLPALENLVETAKQTFDNVVGRGFSIKYPQSGSQLEEAIDVAEKIDEELARLNRNRPTDITQVSVWERTHSALVPQLRAANKRVESLTALAFECEARIKAAPKVKEALQRLDGRAAISFTICAETGGQTDILLAAASGTGRDY